MEGRQLVLNMLTFFQETFEKLQSILRPICRQLGGAVSKTYWVPPKHQSMGGVGGNDTRGVIEAPHRQRQCMVPTPGALTQKFAEGIQHILDGSLCPPIALAIIDGGLVMFYP